MIPSEIIFATVAKSAHDDCVLAARHTFELAQLTEVDAATRMAIETAVTLVFGIDRRALAGSGRGKQPVAHARQVAMYLAHVCCGKTLTEVGRIFDRDRTTVAHACIRTEQRRDEPQFDRALDLLGWAIPAMIARPEQYDFLH